MAVVEEDEPCRGLETRSHIGVEDVHPLGIHLESCPVVCFDQAMKRLRDACYQNPEGVSSGRIALT